MVKHTQTICPLLPGVSALRVKVQCLKMLCKHISARCYFKPSFKNFKNPFKLLVIERLFAAINNDFLRAESLQKKGVEINRSFPSFRNKVRFQIFILTIDSGENF